MTALVGICDHAKCGEECSDCEHNEPHYMWNDEWSPEQCTARFCMVPNEEVICKGAGE